MNALMSSTTFVTAESEAARRFYDKYFDTWYPFDAGWYVLLRLGRGAGAPEIGFMEPRDSAQPFSGGAMLNVVVDNVDDLYGRMIASGETIAIPLASNPWGDRGFGVVDPIGLMVYCHQPIEPAEEFRRFIQKSPEAKRGS